GEARHVGARSRLGEAPGADRLAGGEAREVAPPLLLGAGARDRAAAEARARARGHGRRRAGPRELDADDRRLDVREAGAAVLPRETPREDPGSLERREVVVGRRLSALDGVGAGRDLAVARLADASAERSQLGREELVHCYDPTKGDSWARGRSPRSSPPSRSRAAARARRRLRPLPGRGRSRRRRPARTSRPSSPLS